MQLLNDLLRPVAVFIKPIMRISVFVPGFLGQVVADVALSLLASPLLIILIVLFSILGFTTSGSNMTPLLAAVVVELGCGNRRD